MEYYHGIDNMEAQVKLQHDTTNIEQWCRSNKLTANVSKCACMFIGIRQRLCDAPDLNILLNGKCLSDLQQYDYLGLAIKCDLMWDLHIKKLCS